MSARFIKDRPDELNFFFHLDACDSALLNVRDNFRNARTALYRRPLLRLPKIRTIGYDVEENPFNNVDDAGIVLLVKQGNENEEHFTTQIEALVVLGADGIVVRRNDILSSTRTESPEQQRHRHDDQPAVAAEMEVEFDVDDNVSSQKKSSTDSSRKQKPLGRGGTSGKRPGLQGKLS